MPEIDWFLPPLLGGFFFSLFFYPLAFWSVRQRGYRLLLATVSVAAVFVLVTQLIFVFTSEVLWIRTARARVRDTFPYTNSDLSILATFLIPIALLLGQLARIRPVWRPKALTERVVAAEGGPLLDALLNSFASGSYLLVTLRSGKVYVGAVSMTFSPFRQPTSIRWILQKSGYRTQPEQEVILDVPYEETHRQIREDFEREIDNSIQSALDLVEMFEVPTEAQIQAVMQEVYAEIQKKDELEDIASQFAVNIPISEILTIAPHAPGIFEHFGSVRGIGR